MFQVKQHRKQAHTHEKIHVFLLPSEEPLCMICNEEWCSSVACFSPTCDLFFCIILYRNRIINSPIAMLHSVWYWSQDMRSDCLFKHISAGWNAYHQGDLSRFLQLKCCITLQCMLWAYQKGDNKYTMRIQLLQSIQTVISSLKHIFSFL